MNLYADVVYAYAFEGFVTEKIKLPVNLTPMISNYWFSFFVQAFGKDYGMIPTLKNSWS